MNRTTKYWQAELIRFVPLVILAVVLICMMFEIGGYPCQQ